ncbi:MAG TPA: hypothetical protein VKB28_22580 [Solirubrobacteraceae bacterium]|nr:hypothetical protein [Solirubrobacteraceae bacterium]
MAVVHPGSETSHVKALPVDGFVRAVCAEADELREGDADPPPRWVAAEGYCDAIRRGYSILSELTHPNNLATTLSHARNDEWNLQPEIGTTVMAATLRPSWIALTAARVALRDLVKAASDHPMEFPDADPGFAADELNPRTRIWK